MATPTTTQNPIIEVANILAHRGGDGGAPIVRNNVGFNKVDYPMVCRGLDRIRSRAPTKLELRLLFLTLRKYHRQIGELGYALEDLQAAIALGVDQVVIVEDDEDEDEVDDEPEVYDGDVPDDESDASDEDTSWHAPPMVDILGPNGLIARGLPGYESRPTQIELAQAMCDAITNGEHCIGEAGTGTGKSLAYLLAAILQEKIAKGEKTRKKVIVSTEGKALQDQLSRKDLPFLASVLPEPFTFAVLKGIGNFVCRHRIDERLEEQAQQGLTQELRLVLEWAKTTEIGDLAELPYSLSPEGQRGLTVSSDECLGKECPYYGSCFHQKAKQRAEDADIVIVNHTLLTLDLAFRRLTDDAVKILPDRDVVIVDEMHALEDVATKAFTVEINEWAVRNILQGKLPALAGLSDALMNETRTANDALFRVFIGDQRQTFTVPQGSEVFSAAALRLASQVRQCGRQADRATIQKDELIQEQLTTESEEEHAARVAKEMAARARKSAMRRIQLERYSKRCDALADNIVALTEADDEHVLFVEKTKRENGSADTIAIKRAPISVAGLLKEALWDRWPVIATSATLTTHGNFDYIKERTGASDEVNTVSVESPFDYQRNALIYLPANGGAFDPSRYYQAGSLEYFDRLGAEIEQLILASDGRAFILFTSRRALNEVYQRIAPRLRWLVLKQGDASPQALLSQFKADGHAVLFGLRSFMTGVDVQGEALSLVVIDKLPFPTPDEPVYQARSEAVNREYGDQWAWFHHLALPICATTFKQATGRLIRTKTDRGVIALMDGRLTVKKYSTGIICSLPPAPVTRSMDVVRAFFAASA